MKIKTLLFVFVLSTINIVAQWNQQANILGKWQLALHMDVVDSNKVLVVVRPSVENQNGFLLTDDKGKNWKQIEYPFGNASGIYGFNSISMLSSGSIWVAYDDKIYANTSNNPFSNKWELQFSDTTLVKYIVYVKMFDTMRGIAMGAAKDMYSSAIFLQTTNGGANWIRTDKSNLTGWTLSVCDPTIKFFDENVGYISVYKWFAPNSSGPDSLYKTTNGGKDWKAIKASLAFSSIRVFPNDRIMSWKKDELRITTNGGLSWTTTKPPFTTSCLDFWLDEKNSSNIWALSSGNSNGLWYSKNGGTNFTFVANGGYRKMGIVNNKTGYVFGDNGNFLVTNNIQYYTTGLNDNGNTTPTNYSLDQNYPNPFNPSTRISYEIPKAGIVAIKVYDQLGREISTLVNEFKQAGKYEEQFSVNNFKLSSGIYFYSLKSGGFFQTKKMIYLK